MMRYGTLSADEIEFIHRVDSAPEVVQVIRDAGLLPAPR
jgi:hypothetical protein